MVMLETVKCHAESAGPWRGNVAGGTVVYGTPMVTLTPGNRRGTVCRPSFFFFLAQSGTERDQSLVACQDDKPLDFASA